MADKLRITTEVLTKDTDSFKEKTSILTSAIEGMKDDVALLHGMWKGPSHEAFTAQFNSDMEAAEMLIKQLTDYSAKLESAAAEYQRCSNQVDSYIDSIRL